MVRKNVLNDHENEQIENILLWSIEIRIQFFKEKNWRGLTARISRNHIREIFARDRTDTEIKYGINPYAANCLNAHQRDATHTRGQH